MSADTRDPAAHTGQEPTIAVPGPKEDDRYRRGGPCAAKSTGDLLDCDCGYISTQHKIRLITERDEHDAHDTAHPAG